jgi:hypothetical protein
MVAGLSQTGYEEMCREIGLKTLEERRKVQDLVLLHGRGGLTIENLFERAGEREWPRTRQAVGANNLKLPMARTEIRKNFFSVRVVIEWNELPDNMKSMADREKFKRALRIHRDTGGRS